MKKILVLGGSYQHIKIVKAAQKLGVKTYVTDFLPIERSPAKMIADCPLMLNITDVDAIVEFCKTEKIDGVIGPYIDVAQLPYQKICEKMNYPCFGNEEQHKILTDKKLFKEFCLKNGVEVIPSYTEDDVRNHLEKIKFPLLVKPTDSRGSRGQTICNKIEEVVEAVEFAKQFSRTNDVIIEKYMGQANDLQLVYMVINSEPVLVRVEDRYTGSRENGFDKLCIASLNPSVWENVYRKKADEIVKSMIKKIGLVNAPVFIQAFMDHGVVRPYDPGLRFPGDDFDDCYKAITNIDIPEMLVKFALSGEISEELFDGFKNARLTQPSMMILPCLKTGKIVRIEGYDELKKNPCFVSMSKAYKDGDVVEETRDVRQRFGEFCIVTENMEEMQKTVRELFDKLKVFNERGENMLIEKFDVQQLKEMTE